MSDQDILEGDSIFTPHRPLIDQSVIVQTRGGVSLIAAFTGMLVTFGALMVIGTIMLLVMFAYGYRAADLDTGGLKEFAVGGVIALLAVQFLSYMWGGYAAGRMARGSGAINGLLVALLALIVILAAGEGAVALGFTSAINPSMADRIASWSFETSGGLALGVGMILAMLSGAMLGGIRGLRWHTDLENQDGSMISGRHRVIDVTDSVSF